MSTSNQNSLTPQGEFYITFLELMEFHCINLTGESIMATLDVPGANPANKDYLSPLNWAEHEDGSLILVMHVMRDRGEVIFSMFDLKQDAEYKTVMSISDFERKFSSCKEKLPDDPTEKWTWHDKTPFPYDRLFKRGRAELTADEKPMRVNTISETIDDSATARVGRAINAEAKPLDPTSLVEKSKGMLGRIRRWSFGGKKDGK